MTKLDRCWKNCLRMWKWVSEKWEESFAAIPASERGVIVSAPKAQWLRDHRFTKALDEDCFFCQYVGANECSMCPAALIDPSFHCADHDHYCWCWEPKAFYRKLLRLDAKRTGKKKP